MIVRRTAIASILAASALVIAGCGMMNKAPGGVMTVPLSGQNEVPPNSSGGSGTGKVELDGNVLKWNVSYSGLTGPVSPAYEMFHFRVLPSSSTLPVPEPPLAFGGTSFCADSGTVMAPPPDLFIMPQPAMAKAPVARIEAMAIRRTIMGLSPAVGGPARTDRRAPDLADHDRAFTRRAVPGLTP